MPCPRRLCAEKSPAIETKTIAPENHKDSPAAALRREIPRGRNETKRTRYAAGRGRPALPKASSALKPDTLSFRASVEKSPAMEPERNIYAPAKCPRRLCAEKSPAVETKTNEHVMRRDEGVPPYRRLRPPSNQTPTSFRASVEKSPAIEPERNIYAPAKCPRRLCADRHGRAEKRV